MGECVIPEILINKIVIDAMITSWGDLALIMSTGEVILVGASANGQILLTRGH